MDALNGIKDSFSSWDKCMAKAYCKWPVIIGIVIGSLIVLSVVFCVARCMCCAGKCMCCCFKCCASCGGSGNKKHKHLDSHPNTPYGPGPTTIYNQYQSAPQPVYQHNPYSQIATFEGPSKIHEDSLPAMPSWENAASRKVEVVEDAPKPESHELEKLNPEGRTASPAMTGFAAPKPTRPGQASLPHSPYNESDTFLGAQSSGITGHGDSHSGYRGASPNPGAIGSAYANHRPGGGFQSTNSFGSRPDLYSRSDFQSNTNFNNHTGQGGGGSYGGNDNGRFYDQRPDYGRQASNPSHHDVEQGYSPPRSHWQQNKSPASPVYSGSTAYEQDRYQAYSPVHGAQGQGQQGRRPANGTWKDV